MPTYQSVVQSKLPPHERRHAEWIAHHMRWRWLLDSWEGGEAYRLAEYGSDSFGLPIRNLIRHKREYPDWVSHTAHEGNPYFVRPVGSDPAYDATSDDYTMRLARTPVPTFVLECVDTHLSRIYAREIKRESPSAALTEWWLNVDGAGTMIDHFMAETIAPILLVEGCIDLVFDHPSAPDDEEVATRADQLRLNLDSCVVSYVLPENMLWWKLDQKGDYVECLIREMKEDGPDEYRYWTESGWTLFDENGGKKKEGGNPFGRVPIKRVFDRKRPRCRNVGMSRYEAIAEHQREYYNRDSELILSDTTQAHPLLQGPEDFIQADGTMPVGPSWLLPMKKNTAGSGVTYAGFSVIDFPKGGADSLRANKSDLRDAVDRQAMLTKPAGSAGTSGGTVSQSGISKRLDAEGGNDLLAKIAGVLQRCEQVCAEFVLLVMGDGVVDQAALAETTITYPKSFDLAAPGEFLVAFAEWQQLLSLSGSAPEIEADMLGRALRLLVPGLDDDEYEEWDQEITAALQEKTRQVQTDRLAYESQQQAQLDARQIDATATASPVEPANANASTNESTSADE